MKKACAYASSCITLGTACTLSLYDNFFQEQVRQPAQLLIILILVKLDILGGGFLKKTVIFGDKKPISTDPDVTWLWTTSTGVSLACSTTSEKVGSSIVTSTSLEADEVRGGSLKRAGLCLVEIWKPSGEVMPACERLNDPTRHKSIAL
ncbi:hypothetical protein BYT27DRAFT_6937101 [Phlegmacium glaucopus]|nr:hypothetical protein BYT27DRAFT_6937101 [Phlegmacium glaucopus]